MILVMTKEEKQLLLIDLCARLPYDPKIRWETSNLGDKILNLHSGIINILLKDEAQHEDIKLHAIEKIKPYLRPLSSMTEEEKQYISDKCGFSMSGPIGGEYQLIMPIFAAEWLIDFYNEHHFDYRGLIEKSLAIVAPEGMYKTK